MNTKNLDNVKIIDLYINHKMSGIEISKVLNVHYCTVYRHIKKLNKTKEMSLAKRKYNINDNYFSLIDSEDKAYFLGFLYADGYNNTKKHEVSITLQPRDVEILNVFNLKLESNKPLRKDGIYIKLAIENKKISEDLNNLGCVKAKSHFLKFPQNLSNELIRHFIRGYFDGDGSVCITKTCSMIQITSNGLFLRELQTILMKNCSLNETKLGKRHRKYDNDILTMSYGGKKQLGRIYHYLYDDSTYYLARKKIKLEFAICANNHLVQPENI